MSTDSLYPETPILLVDDEPAWLHSLSLSLKVSAGINHVVLCHDSRDAMALLEERRCCAALLDLTMPYLDGETLLRNISKNYPDIPVIIVSGLNQIDTAIRCIKAGAADFYVKTDDRERIASGVVRVLKQSQMQLENRRLAEQLLQKDTSQHPAFTSIITESRKLHGIFSYLQAITKSDEPVLITGESGTGKELMVRALHQLSCPNKPCVAVNVAGLDDMVFSDTLFGHVRGAYTGAEQNRKGMVEEAGDGLLFLDEIGDLSQTSQIKLLRLLQEKEFYPLGSDHPVKSRARIVAASNKKLSSEVAEGTFRRDLHYRLASHQLEIPPLRQRKDDIKPLLAHFLAEAAEHMGKREPTTPPELLTLLSAYSFPGNVRELRAMVYDAVSVHNGGVLSMERFKAAMGIDSHTVDCAAPSSPKKVQFFDELPTLKEVSWYLIEEALRRSQGNQSIAARMLGVTPQALSKRLK